MPSNAVAYVAAQLGIRDVACLAEYAARPRVLFDLATARMVERQVLLPPAGAGRSPLDQLRRGRPEPTNVQQ